MCSFWLPLLWASTFQPQPFSQMVQSAPIVIRGQVGDSYSDWGTNDEGSKEIFTYSDIQVTEVLQGTVDTTKITIRELGGEKDGAILHIPGTSTYSPGEDVVILLNEPTKDKTYPVRGMSLGKYNVVSQPDGTLSLQGETAEHWNLNELRELLKKRSSPEKTVSIPTPTAIPSEIPFVPSTKFSMPPAWTYLLVLLGLVLILVLVKR